MIPQNRIPSGPTRLDRPGCGSRLQQSQGMHRPGPNRIQSARPGRPHIPRQRPQMCRLWLHTQEGLRWLGRPSGPFNPPSTKAVKPAGERCQAQGVPLAQGVSRGRPGEGDLRGYRYRVLRRIAMSACPAGLASCQGVPPNPSPPRAMPITYPTLLQYVANHFYARKAGRASGRAEVPHRGL